MGTLVTFADELEAEGGSLALVHIAPPVQRQFDTLGLNDFFKRFRSREEATRAFYRRHAAAGAAPAPQERPAAAATIPQLAKSEPEAGRTPEKRPSSEFRVVRRPPSRVGEAATPVPAPEPPPPPPPPEPKPLPPDVPAPVAQPTRGQIIRRSPTRFVEPAPARGPAPEAPARAAESSPPGPATPPAAPPGLAAPADLSGVSSEWTSPLVQRYAGRAMVELFSDRRRFATWRELWIALAEAEKELGLPITEEQLAELRAARHATDARRASEIERETRHDVMAHIRHYGEQAPGAAGILHLGATSMYVVDNTDLILMREALDLLVRKTARACRDLAAFARKWKDAPALGYTHLQPAQVTTVGRRACLWLQDFLLDLRELRARRDGLRFLGVKGAIGTQASFLALFSGDARKVEELDRLVTRKLGFASAFRVTGQTYTRKVDAQVLAALSGLAQSAAKFSNDVRLSQSRFELQEPFASGQVGSSAMAYKQNPARSERICGLARFLIALEQNLPLTAAAQWFERTLDDSANKRLAVPEAFLVADAILNLVIAVAGGLVVHPKVIENNLRQELPFVLTEDLLMAAVKAGGDRQELHERIRRHSVDAAARVREEGKPNDLIERLQFDPAFRRLGVRWDDLLDARRYVGRAPEQVELFLAEEVEPALRDVPEVEEGDLEVKV
jgi:adenylosuccinate lyase